MHAYPVCGACVHVRVRVCVCARTQLRDPTCLFDPDQDNNGHADQKNDNPVN